MKVINTGIAEISYDENKSLLYVKLNEDVEITVEKAGKHYEEIVKLTGNKKHFALVDASNYFTAELKALEYMSRQEVLTNRVASAHYNSVIANKFTINFYKVNCKPAIDIKIFDTKEEALDWLKTLAHKKKQLCGE